MTSSPRRPGFRLPWAGTEGQADAAAVEATAATGSAAAGSTVDAADPKPPATEGQQTTDVSAPPAAVNGHAPAPPGSVSAEQPVAATPQEAASQTPLESPNPFLRSLVDAMRGVAEETRSSSLAELKAKVEQRVEHLGASGTELAEDLRRRSELDIKGIGEWERGEIERIRGEASRKVEARRQQLEQDLVERQQTTEREIEATRARLADHERELSAFVAQLAEINDPTAFVSAARQMPRAPSLDTAVPRASAEANPSPQATSDTLTARLALLGAAGEATSPASDGGITNGSSATAHEEPADVTTAIIVGGLGSFGAITSFKQSLEKSAGVRSVALSLGPSGEFVYRASHDVAFDIEAAIREVESGAASIERQPDGTLRVTVIRPR